MLLLRAFDKLAEARYFVGRMWEVDGLSDEFRFYFSAAISALRSISLVLQADLRPHHRDSFDSWWEANRDKLRNPEFPFELITTARNAVLKQGNRVPRLVILTYFEDGPIERAEVRLDLSKSGKVRSPYYHYRKGHPELGASVTAEEWQNMTPEEQSEELSQRIQGIDDRWPLWRGESFLKGFEFERGGRIYRKPELIAGFRDVLDRHQALLEEAKQLFPISDDED